MSEQKATIRFTFGDMLQMMREAMAITITLTTPRKPLVNVLARYELLERLLPVWLTLQAHHDLSIALNYWSTQDFGALIGRAVVLPIERGEYFTDPEALWDAARLGLGEPSQVYGRPQAVGETDQLLIFHLWNSRKRTQQELADDFDIGLATVGRIIKKWKSKELTPLGDF